MPARRTNNVKVEPPQHWEIYNEYTVDKNTVLEAGDECKIKGQQGTYKFIRFVINKEIENHEGWIDLFGGPANYGSYRSVKPDMVKPNKRRGKK